MITLSLSFAVIAAALGITLALQWRGGRDSPLPMILAHGCAGLFTLMFLLIAPGGFSARYAWTVGAVALALATGILMLLMRDRQHRRPPAALTVHIGAAVIAIATLAAGVLEG